MKRSNKILLLLLVICPIYALGQTLNLTPAAMIPNVITITAVNAGDLPSDPLVNNTSQSIRYAFKKLGGWGSSDFGTIELNSWWIPPGFGVKIQADPYSGAHQKNGKATGVVTVSSTWKLLIYDIKTGSTITRPLTQSVFVSDFSKVSIGSYSVTINYRMNW